MMMWGQDSCNFLESLLRQDEDWALIIAAGNVVSPLMDGLVYGELLAVE